MRIAAVILIAASIVAVSFFGSLYVMGYFWPLCPRGVARFQLQAPFPKYLPEGGYLAGLPPDWNEIGNEAGVLDRSPTAVCENNLLMGLANSRPADVASKGKGLSTHWKNLGVIFSAKDNSDPNTNQRQYWIVRLR